ncbi:MULTISPECIES: LysR family transcriptional regulator [Vogesella]|jgi:DNA-binding transcriptional LysR family regulator|uniref:LysR family transcriptional regulator n=1 Tax=Vogesella TaxID=57739 RepID=UPI001478E22C|nr:LysR family transcriptional regulator [Vogesella urethralis]MEC5208555.1 DNA-binding transcriptional LysR family regulator [Vogesella perlucida]
MKLSLDALMVLDAIDRRGSFAAAAEELYRVPSAITYSVQKLEQDLNVQLFDRSGHKARLTSTGELLLKEGRSLLDSAAMIESRVKTHATGWEGELRIAMSDLLFFDDVLQLLEEFNQLGADTELRISREVFGGTWDALVDGRADLAIGATENSQGGHAFQTRSMGKTRFVFCVSPDHPLASAEEPIPQHLIRRYRVAVAADTSRSLPPRSVSIQEGQSRLTVATVEDKIAVQRAGLGVGFLPLCRIHDDVAAGRLVIKEVEEKRTPVQLHYAWKEAQPGQALSWFIKRLQTFEWKLS